MSTNRNAATLEQGAASKNNLKASTRIIPQPSRHRKPRITRRALQAELQFLLASKAGDR